MPRNALTDEQKAFVRKNALKGGNWLAEALNVNRADIYQYATTEGFSVKKGGKYDPKEKSIRRMKRGYSMWPMHYRKYKKYLVMRDGLRCHYCDTLVTYDEVQIDHVLARARGGSDAPHNLVLACPQCNHVKGTLCYTCPEFREAIK
jgi:5-methylcytosine-specific restriction endonuclease McrA